LSPQAQTVPSERRAAVNFSPVTTIGTTLRVPTTAWVTVTFRVPTWPDSMLVTRIAVVP